jgi:hypothetical protein
MSLGDTPRGSAAIGTQSRRGSLWAIALSAALVTAGFGRRRGELRSRRGDRVGLEERVLPAIEEIAGYHSEKTVFTRFIPPATAEEMPGAWQRYFRQWEETTLERIDPRH